MELNDKEDGIKERNGESGKKPRAMKAELLICLLLSSGFPTWFSQSFHVNAERLVYVFTISFKEVLQETPFGGL